MKCNYYSRYKDINKRVIYALMKSNERWETERRQAIQQVLDKATEESLRKNVYAIIFKSTASNLVHFTYNTEK